MDLDALKKSWRDLEKGQELYNEEQLKGILTKKSNSALGSIRKNMFLDLAAGLFLAILALLFVVLRGSSVSLIGLIFLALLVLSILFLAYPRLYRHSKTQTQTENVKSNLHKTINLLKLDLRFYEKLHYYLYPLALGVALLLDQRMLNFYQSHIPAGMDKVSLMVGTIIVLGLILYFVFKRIVKWWIKIAYSKYVDQLNGMLHELDEENTA